MSETPDIRRRYFFSDTYGGHSDPLKRLDPDALICTDFRSNPVVPRNREFDIYGELAQMNHVVELILDEHIKTESRKHLRNKVDEFRNTITAIFVNTAERTEDNGNGDNFYVATALEGSVRIVTTPLSVLSSIKDKIETLQVLPNENNGLYENGEQFRSSYTPALLELDHGIELDDANIDDIPDLEKELHLAYVDRFGNMVTYAGLDQLHELRQIIVPGNGVDVSINHMTERVKVSNNLADAIAGRLNCYENGNLDIVHKWSKDQTPQERLETSAYSQFNKPPIGSLIQIS